MQENYNFHQKKKSYTNLNGKYTALMLGKNLVFIDSLQFINSSLKQNLPKNKFKYLSQELTEKNWH